MTIKSTEQAGLHETLFAAIQSYLSNLDVVHLCEPGDSYPYIDLVPHSLPVQTRVNESLLTACKRSLPVVQAIIGAKSFLKWQQSYSVEDGFDAQYLDNYGWFNLISPDGPFVSENIRVSFGYWGEGLYYKEHWHEPEETYVVLAGSAVFHSEGRESRSCVADDVIHHVSNQRHAIDMQPGPLLAMAIWRGQSLTRKPNL